jgi:CubicO group peptidase (beta-lactamase class C family)
MAFIAGQTEHQNGAGHLEMIPLKKIHRSKALSAVATLVLSIVSILASNSVHADAIDDFVKQELARQRIPGAAVGIMQHGQLVRAAGYGYANIEHQVPVHPDTIFQSGSIGKQFTAAAVMLLVEDGKVKLDESIRTYLPKAPKRWAPITIRRLLTHTSGMAGDPGFDLRRDYSDDELLEILYKLKLDFAPGARWSYSNSAYVLLGLMIRKVSGETYGDVLAKRVFGPLHMSTARVISDRDIVPNRAAGYEVTDTAILNQDWVAPTGNSTADGALYLTVLDYAKWEAGMHAGKVLKPDSWAQVYTPVRLNSGKSFPYGLGWMLETVAGQPVYQHGGSWQGFQTFFIRYTGDAIAVVVLTNSSSGNPESIARGIAARYEPKLALPPGVPVEDREPAVTERLQRLIEQIVTGKLDARQFSQFTPEEVVQYAEYNRSRLQPLGALQELKLFRRSELGDDASYNYRARFANGLMDVAFVLDPGKKVSQLWLEAVDRWDDPLPP